MLKQLEWSRGKPRVNVDKLRQTIEQLLASQPDNKRLRDNLEGLVNAPSFPGLTWFWGPRLYARSRPLFRPLILNQFSDWLVDDSGSWKKVRWTEHAVDLETWLDAARSARDVVLVRKLQSWKFAKQEGWGRDNARFCEALKQAYKSAPTPAARTIVLDEFDDWFDLDEATARDLYQTDRAASPFILKHLPRYYWNDKKREMWDGLGGDARIKGDNKLYYALYRALMPAERWNAEVILLADGIPEVARLNDALEERHLSGYGIERSATMIKLLEKRGRDVMPYVRAHLDDLVGGWRGDPVKPVLDLATKNGWWDLWASAIRSGRGNQHFNKAVEALVKDEALDELARVERLKALAGVSREWNWPGVGLAVVHELHDYQAVALYKRYPDLVRGPFRPNVTPRWWRGSEGLLQALLLAGDEEMIDIVASRYATRVGENRSNDNATAMTSFAEWEKSLGNDPAPEPSAPAKAESNKKRKPKGKGALQVLAEYYQAIRDRDDAEFARRASNVLTRIPAFSIYDFNSTLRGNPLARLLFVRSLESYLGVPGAVRDLVEGSEINVQKLAYRILAQNDIRARALAAQNIDILVGTLLRPIFRKTRLPAFDALANAARHDAATGERVLSRARDALRLPDKKYPKEELIGLIAKVIAANPSLAAAGEQPVIYRRAPAPGTEATP